MSMSIEEVVAHPRTPKTVPPIPTNVLQQFSMKGRVVVVTGAADGIGYAVAEAMAEAGADVALWYHTNDAAVTKAAALADAHPGVRTRADRVDVSDPEAVRAALARVAAALGRVDCFVANAGKIYSCKI